MKIEEMNFSLRTYNCLKRAGINTTEQIEALSQEELFNIKNMGHKQVNEIAEKLYPGRKMDPEIAALTGFEWIRGLSEFQLAWVLTNLIVSIGSLMQVPESEIDFQTVKDSVYAFLISPVGETTQETLERLEMVK